MNERDPEMRALQEAEERMADDIDWGFEHELDDRERRNEERSALIAWYYDNMERLLREGGRR